MSSGCCRCSDRRLFILILEWPSIRGRDREFVVEATGRRSWDSVVCVEVAGVSLETEDNCEVAGEGEETDVFVATVVVGSALVISRSFRISMLSISSVPVAGSDSLSVPDLARFPVFLCSAQDWAVRSTS